MLARILFISDLHKRYKDSESIRGQIEASECVQNDIIAFNKEHGVTHNIIMGDWYDRGFHGLGQAYGAMEMDRRLSASVNGNVYLCIGNHFYLERDENPEMYIIQPNTLYKPMYNIPLPETPIFRCVPQLRIGGVQIDFFHFNKLNKQYVAYREPDTTFHIGVYHDDACVPSWVREQEGYSTKTAQGYLNEIYGNIDLALHGHIHTAIGMTNVAIQNGRKIPLCIPGALGIVQNKESVKHPSVQLPVVDIHEDGTVTMKLAKFSTHIEMMKFASKKPKKELPKDIDPMSLCSKLTSPAFSSLDTYLTSKGYNHTALRLVDAAVAETLTLYSAVQICSEEIH